jgi:hypothetical protein
VLHHHLLLKENSGSPYLHLDLLLLEILLHYLILQHHHLLLHHQNLLDYRSLNHLLHRHHRRLK